MNQLVTSSRHTAYRLAAEAGFRSACVPGTAMIRANAGGTMTSVHVAGAGSVRVGDVRSAEPAARSLAWWPAFAPPRPGCSGRQRAGRARSARHSRIPFGVIPRQGYQPAEHPDHEQVDKTDQHERRA